MGPHADAVAVLTGWTAPDAQQDGLRAGYLDHLQRHDDGALRECLPAHVTASAAVFDHTLTHTLLTLHGRVRRWLQPGGHCEHGDATLAAAALREITEESGIAGLELLGDPIRLDRHYVNCGGVGQAIHLDVQYAAVAPPSAQPRISHESVDLGWFPVDALPEPTDDSVRRLVADAVWAAAG